jgi:hypothetical protein
MDKPMINKRQFNGKRAASPFSKGKHPTLLQAS